MLLPEGTKAAIALHEAERGRRIYVREHIQPNRLNLSVRRLRFKNLPRQRKKKKKFMRASGRVRMLQRSSVRCLVGVYQLAAMHWNLSSRPIYLFPAPRQGALGPSSGSPCFATISSPRLNSFHLHLSSPFREDGSNWSDSEEKLLSQVFALKSSQIHRDSTRFIVLYVYDGAS